MDTSTKQIVVRAIPVDLWKQLKVKAAQQDQTIQAAVTQAIEQYLKTA